VAAVAAELLGLPLDVTVAVAVKPGGSQLSLGAVAPGGVQALDQAVIAELGVPHWMLDYLVAAAAHIALGEERALRREVGRAFPPRAALLVDDGLSELSALKAAASSLRERGVDLIGVAAPLPGSEPGTTSYVLDRRPSEGDVRQLLREAVRRSQEVLR
jgi:putative phosphoribosyl transferase